MSGFSSEHEALAFEFAWKHPKKIGFSPFSPVFLVKTVKDEYAQLRAATATLVPGANSLAWGLRVLELMVAYGKWRGLTVVKAGAGARASAEVGASSGGVKRRRSGDEIIVVED